MKYTRSFIVVLTTVIISSCCKAPVQPDYHVCAFIWPSCHDDSLGRTNWEQGIGEWEVIQKGDPRFPGHYQPKQPLWGYEMDNDPVDV